MRATIAVCGMALTLAAALLVPPSQAGDAFTGSCKTKPNLPCSISAGQTFDGHTIAAADDSEENVEAVLGAIQDTNKVDVEPLVQDIREDTGDWNLTPNVLGHSASREMSWNYEGDPSDLAYVTMVSEGDDATGFAIAAVFADSQGTVDFREILPFPNDSGFGVTVSFWTSTFAPPCKAIELEERGGGQLVDNCKLTPIKKGKVGCVDIETLDVTKCKFKDGRSGEVLHAKKGNKKYARVTGTLSKTGNKNGNFAMAMKLSGDGEPTCADPAGGGNTRGHRRDSTGTASSTPLAKGCTVEIMNSSTNRSGQPLRNFATRIVCTSSNPHPDGLTPISNPSPGVYCYTGAGAALNDKGGQERNAQGRYYPDTAACHMIVLSPSYTIWGAKRPRNAGSTIVTDSPILWRPVAPLPIANN